MTDDKIISLDQHKNKKAQEQKFQPYEFSDDVICDLLGKLRTAGFDIGDETLIHDLEIIYNLLAASLSRQLGDKNPIVQVLDNFIIDRDDDGSYTLRYQQELPENTFIFTVDPDLEDE